MGDQTETRRPKFQGTFSHEVWWPITLSPASSKKSPDRGLGQTSTCRYKGNLNSVAPDRGPRNSRVSAIVSEFEHGSYRIAAKLESNGFVEPRGESNLAQAIRMGASNSISQTGQQIVEPNLNVQPTMTIRPGFPVLASS